VKYRRFCTRSVNSPLAYVRFASLYCPATNDTLPRPDFRSSRRHAGRPNHLNSIPASPSRGAPFPAHLP
jgi:hypothetical protein